MITSFNIQNELIDSCIEIHIWIHDKLSNDLGTHLQCTYSWVNLVVPKNWAVYFSAISGRKFDLTTVLRSCWPLGHWKCLNREGRKGQFRVKVASSSLLSFLERLDWPNCTQRQGPTGRLFFSIWGGFGSGIEKKVGWRGGSGRVEELNFWPGISGYLFSGISVYVEYFRVYRVYPIFRFTRYFGLPNTQWLSKTEPDGVRYRKNVG